MSRDIPSTAVVLKPFRLNSYKKIYNLQNQYMASAFKPTKLKMFIKAATSKPKGNKLCRSENNTFTTLKIASYLFQLSNLNSRVLWRSSFFKHFSSTRTDDVIDWHVIDTGHAHTTTPPLPTPVRSLQQGAERGYDWRQLCLPCEGRVFEFPLLGLNCLLQTWHCVNRNLSHERRVYLTVNRPCRTSTISTASFNFTGWTLLNFAFTF